MAASGDLEPISELRHVYTVTAPFAQPDLVEEEQILMEAHPYAALAYLSALAFHGLTQQVPREIQAMIPRKPPADVLPLGTTAEDWWDIERPTGQTPARIRGRAVEWFAVQPRQYFGILEYRLHGHPVWVTAPEKALLDGLQNPDRCGGIEDVLSAWREARDTLSVDAVIEYVDRLDINLLRQRVGFILDELSLGNALTDEWAKSAKRGGSSKLVSSEPYAPVFSEKWNLSLNAPTASLVG
ncbi:MAG: hypothetical protein HYX51_03715 [Chloroflexi bacterium]|nr:hypothetical protein [Chloroflexota bacterium]